MKVNKVLLAGVAIILLAATLIMFQIGSPVSHAVLVSVTILVSATYSMFAVWQVLTPYGTRIELKNVEWTSYLWLLPSVAFLTLSVLGLTASMFPTMPMDDLDRSMIVIEASLVATILWVFFMAILEWKKCGPTMDVTLFEFLQRNIPEVKQVSDADLSELTQWSIAGILSAGCVGSPTFTLEAFRSRNITFDEVFVLYRRYLSETGHVLRNIQGQAALTSMFNEAMGIHGLVFATKYLPTGDAYAHFIAFDSKTGIFGLASDTGE